MDDPEDQTDATTEEVEETTTDAADTEGPDIAEKGAAKDELPVATRKRKKKKTWKEQCLKQKWTCDEDALWHVYMKAYAEENEQLEKEDRFKRRKPADIPRLPKTKSVEDQSPPYKCLPVGAFQMEAKAELPNKLDRSKKIRIWKSMHANAQVDTPSSASLTRRISKTVSDKWRRAAPCTLRDLVSEFKERESRSTKKRKHLFPCDEEERTFDEPTDDFASHKELGHARIPPTCDDPKAELLVDRAAGERPGLVDGDYIVFELSSKKKGNRVYADVCLRGLKGMHLPELGPLRERRKTWKFCFYQAVVALLAKTQLRYKYAWSVNIDFIYDHAWMLYTHIGTINVKEKQRLDDIVVYNYKYNVELQLIAEMNDVPIVSDADWTYEERNMRRKRKLERPELMDIKLELGSEKRTDGQKAPVHQGTKKIEEWFDKLDGRHKNCIFRTTRFSVAFWKDGLFWYLYNPYRCDEFGYWHDDGYACILKFCTKDSLRRHLMILLLRAYVYAVPRSSTRVAANETDEPNEQTKGEGVFAIQIFRLIYHCCRLHNLKLLERAPPKPRKRAIERKKIDDCPFDPLDVRDPCTIEQEEGDVKDEIEKPTWLKLFKITWAKCSPFARKKGTKEQAGAPKMHWHQYLVEESNKLFSLWGELHCTDGMFEKENRGMQTYACYVVCAGMTRIMAPEYWSSKTLDVIVMCGDRYYTHSKLDAEFRSSRPEYSHVSHWNRYLISHFHIGETMIVANVLPAICGRLYARSTKYLWQSLQQMFLRYHFGILTCESSCLGVFKFCGAYYMCDVNSFGPPLFEYGTGATYLLRATYFHKFMTALIATIGSPECSQFSLNPIEILKVVDVGTADSHARSIEKQERGRRSAKVPCPYDDEKKKQMKKWKMRRAEDKRTMDKTCCKDVD